MITDIGEMMGERLQAWKDNNGGKLPTNILFYRDGVSESQFPELKRTELRDIRDGCRKAGGVKYDPKLTFIVCTKRHHARFFARHNKPDPTHKSMYDAGLNKGNALRNGLVVADVSIRPPWCFDFWLQSHTAIHGTPRSAHYFVIEHGMSIKDDQLKQLVSHSSDTARIYRLTFVKDLSHLLLVPPHSPKRLICHACILRGQAM